MTRAKDGGASPPTGPGVLVILPVLNEIAHIEALLDDLHRNLSTQPYTVLVIDDGSTDGTVEKVQALSEVYRKHLHLMQRKKTMYGSQRGSALYAGVHWGLTHTEHPIFIEMDGDLSHRAVELQTGIHLIREAGYDVAVASKFVPGSRVLNRPLGRKLLSLVSNFLVRTLLDWRIMDYSNGYRFYTRAAAEVLQRHRLVYGSPIYLAEVMALWLRCELRVGEFPSIYVGRNEGLSKLRFIDLIKAALAIFEIGVRYHITGYRSTLFPVPNGGIHD